MKKWFLFASGFNIPPLLGGFTSIKNFVYKGIKPAYNPYLTERRYPAALRRGSSLVFTVVVISRLVQRVQLIFK
jgi:hypothetical protein